MADLRIAVLAAGRGVRFGGHKLETPCAGNPLGRWALEAVDAAGLGPGTIVTGPERVSFAEGWDALVNPDPAAGIGSSLALAAREALERGARSLLVLLADMPLVTAGYLRELARCAPPVATRYPGWSYGVPAMLDRALLEEASRLTGDRGAGALLTAVPGIAFRTPDPAMLRDVDTPEDLAEVERQLLAR
jgi:CTP:molybdopterin cytidylyltransferase MocA